MLRNFAAVLTTIVFLGMLGACGENEIGESCDKLADPDECVDGAICTNEDDGKLVCRKVCEDQEDCDEGYTCNGVSNTSTKSCQPDDVVLI